MGETNTLTGDESPKAIEQRIEGEREQLASALDELNRRRREALDVRLQIRRHPMVAAAFGLALVAGLSLTLWAFANRLRRRPRHFVRFGEALARARRHPERIAQTSPTIMRKVTSSALSSAAGTAAKRAAESFLRSM